MLLKLPYADGLSVTTLHGQTLVLTPLLLKDVFGLIALFC